MLIVTPLLSIIESQVEELKLKNLAVNLENVSDVKLETHVRNGSCNFLFRTPEVWIKHEKWLQIIGTDTGKRCCSLQLMKHTVSLSGEYK